MAKNSFEFYLALDAEMPKDADRFQKSMTMVYENGIEPMQYYEDTVLDANNAVVTTIILVRCRERWKGAVKRFLRKAKFGDTGQKVDGLHVYS